MPCGCAAAQISLHHPERGLKSFSQGILMKKAGLEYGPAKRRVKPSEGTQSSGLGGNR
ncbi:hypothetical protein MPL1032_130157 [Mesorhizobium plurifarium]|uniref:Uncharacterized protein n=1 Tax=Mesorhizobium plurifarium TaxID=69974 RepID=A0A0K2VR82_MESPL|nr:hypothetical protein MPL1032_130157 [Mesorhizobium plurifarium]